MNQKKKDSTYRLACKLYFALGGEQNILGLSSCMSRLRIQVNNIDNVQDDQIFLELGVQGVVRSENSIHLLCGPTSSTLRKYLQSLVNVLRNSIIQACFLSCNSYHNIKNITKMQSSVEITLYNPIDMISVKEMEIFCENEKCSLLGHTLKINCDIPEIEYALTWGLILQAYELIRVLNHENILSINHENGNIYIKINTIENNLSDISWKNIGIESVEIDKEEKKLFFASEKPEEFTEFLNQVLRISRIVNKKNTH